MKGNDRQARRLGAGTFATVRIWVSAFSAGCVAVSALGPAALEGQVAASPPLVVSGTVVEQNGAPASGVAVVLRPYPTVREQRLHDLHGQRALPESVDEARTGGRGGFRLSAPAAGSYRLEVWPTTEASSVVVPALYCSLLPLTAPVVLGELELPALHRLTIRAEDGVGEAIPGALIVADPVVERTASRGGFETVQRQQPCRLGSARGSARTKADGGARFLMPAARSRVVVSASGYAVGGATVVSGRASFRLERDAGTIFRVRDAAGDPVPAVVVAMADEPGGALGLTDERGEAVVGVAAGRVAALEFEATNHAAEKISVRRRVQAGDAAAGRIVDVELGRLAAFRGLVLDRETGEAIPDAAVWFASDPGRGARTDRYGVLNLSAPSGGADLGVAASGYLPAAMRVTATDVHNGVSVSISLAAAAPLRGAVVDDLGRPVPGAHVRAEPSGRGPLAGPRSSGSGRAFSDADGSFWIAAAVYGSPYRLTVAARGYATLVREIPAVEPGGDAAPVQIVMGNGRQPWGTVVDPAGAPVAGAEVRLLWPAENPELEESALAVEATAPAVSNARGEFEFRYVAPGAYGVRVAHPEFVDLRWKGVNVPHGEGYADLGVLTLTVGGEIRGVVLGTDRRPIAGAEVGARQSARSLYKQARSVLTRADGTFRLSGLLPVLADLSVAADGYAPRTIDSVRPSTGEPITIDLYAGASLAGRVRGLDGGAAPGVSVRIRGEEIVDGALSLEHLVRYVETDGDGGFRLDGLLPGVWLVSATGEAGATARRRVELSAGELRETEIRLQDRGRLEALVTNRLDQPVERARVRLRPQDAGRRSAVGSTDASGRVSLPVDAGAATVEARHPGLLLASRDIVLGSGVNEVHLRLHAGWEISGVVLTTEGAPVPGAAVEAVRDFGGDEGGETAARIVAYSRLAGSTPRVASGPDGRFRLTGLDRGRYRLTAGLPGWSSRGESPPVEIAGRSIEGVVIELTPETSLRGAVTGIAPAEMATVEVRAWQGAQFRSATPDFEGNFELRALPAGEWRILAASGERRSPEAAVSLDGNDAHKFVELRFEPGFRLTGQVLVQGAPLRGVVVSVAAPGQRIERRARTDQFGRFEISGLPVGAYRLRAHHESGLAGERSLDLQGDLHSLLIDL